MTVIIIIVIVNRTCYYSRDQGLDLQVFTGHVEFLFFLSINLDFDIPMITQVLKAEEISF